MTSFGKHLAKILLGVLLAGVVGFGPGARGQSQTSSAMAARPDTPDPADQGWHVDVAPYLWFAGVNGTVGTAGRQSSIHVNAGDVLSNVNFGIMAAVDARYNRIVIPVDFMWVKLTDERGLPIGQGTTSLHVRLNEDIFTPKVGYRLVSKERFKVDAVIGIRFWHVGNTLTLQPQMADGRYGATNWVDGVAGARFQWMLTRKVVLAIGGDAGGGGAQLDYQVAGLLGYKVKKVTLMGGWRYLVIHRNPTDRTFVDLAQTGVLIGAVIPLK